MLSAGIPLVDAVTSLLNRGLGASMGGAFSKIRSDLTEGRSFSDAVSEHPNVIPTIYSGMIRAGEASGALDRVLGKIADHAESNARLQGQLRAALTYPIIMMVVGGGIVMFLLAYVVPQVTRVFAEANQTLPLPTRALMASSRILADYGLWMGIGLLLLFIAFRYYASTESGGRRCERWLFSIPWLGRTIKNVIMARFAHTLETMIAGGMPLVEALTVSESSTGSRLISDELAGAREAVSEGESLSDYLRGSRDFNPMLVDMIAVGENSGELEAMLARGAEAIDEEVKDNVATMASVIEPFMILIMAGAVLFVVLAVLLPVFEMNQLVR